MNKELTKRQLQAIKSKDRIYRAAIKLFSLKGYDNVTIEEISSEAGVSKGLFYNYYPSKEAVLLAIFDDVETIYTKINDSFIPGESSKDRLMVFIERVLLHIMDSDLLKETVRVVYINALKANNSFLVTQDREFYRVLQQIIEYGQQRGEIRQDINKPEIIHHIIVHIFGSYFLWMAKSNFDFLKELREHITLIFEGIGTNAKNNNGESID